jgi:hypothetical protein
VDSKFGSLWGEWCSNEPAGLYGVGVWKNIRRGWGMYSSHTRFDVGDGVSARFWNDLWCGDKALKEAIPYLYGIAHIQDASKEALLMYSGDSFQWSVSFARAMHDWEMNVFALFFNLLYSVRVRRDGVDKLWRSPSKKG